MSKGAAIEYSLKCDYFQSEDGTWTAIGPHPHDSSVKVEGKGKTYGQAHGELMAALHKIRGSKPCTEM